MVKSRLRSSFANNRGYNSSNHFSNKGEQMKWKPEFHPKSLYFLTTSTIHHYQLFREDTIKRLLLDTLDCFRLRNKFQLFGFVIMPNHIHLLTRFPSRYPFGDWMRDFKRHSADRINRSDWMPSDGRFFSSGRKEDSNQIWEEGYSAKEIFSWKVMLQKLNYIHRNPCQQHWQLSRSPKDYPWSSARFYLTDLPCIIPIDDARKVDYEDMNISIEN